MNIVLPIEIVENILLYGDPDVTQKYSAVIRQINYYRNEFNYLRKKAFNFYYKWNKHDIIYFIFNRCYYKNQENGLITANKNDIMINKIKYSMRRHIIMG